MNKFLKLAVKITGLLIILYIILAALVLLFVQTDTYKPLITKAFYKATGRKITIEGKIGLSLFPMPTITINQINIANRKGFIAPKSAQYFAKIGKVYVRLHILPLFKAKIRPSKLLLTQASVNLITTPSGKNNWSDLLGVKSSGNKTRSSQPNNSKPNSSNPPANTTEIIISESNIHFINQQTQRKTDITNFSFRAKPVKMSDVYHLAIHCMVHRNNPDTLIRFNTTSTATLDFPKKYYRFDTLKIVTELLKFNKAQRPVTLQLNGKLTIQGQNLHSSFNGIIRQHKGTITLTVNQKNARINASLTINQLPIDPIVTAFSGKTLITGILDFNTQLSTRGNSLETWLKQLDGKGQFKITAGAIYGQDLKYIAINALNRFLSGRSSLKIATKKSSKSSFNAISASYQIQNGVIRTNDIVLNGDQLKASGHGTVNLPKESINLRILTTYTPRPKQQVPILITGNLFSPTVRPDLTALTIQLYKSKTKKGIGNLLDKIRKEINFKFD